MDILIKFFERCLHYMDNCDTYNSRMVFVHQAFGALSIFIEMNPDMEAEATDLWENEYHDEMEAKAQEAWTL